MEKITPLEKEKVLEKIKNGEVKVKKSVIQAEGKAHHTDTAKADKAVKPRPVEEGVPEKSKGKAKPKPEEKPSSPFPCDAQVNAYGFLGFKKQWLDHLGWKVEKGVHGVNIRIEQNADGSITLRKA